MAYKYFSDGQNSVGKTAGQVAGVIVPWYGAARLASSLWSKPYEQADQAADTAAKLQNESVAANNQGMQMGAAPKTEANAFGALGELGDMALPGSVRILNGADTPTTDNAMGAAAMQPTNVDSSQQGYSSALDDYLNYMRYGGSR